MRVPLPKLLERLGVRGILAPYEAAPWLVYDEDKGITCSAEVRMAGSGTDLEGEIQFLYDDEEAAQEASLKEAQEARAKALSALPPGAPPPPPMPVMKIVNGRAQIFIMRARVAADDAWEVKGLVIKAFDYENDFHDWEGKGCDFFLACVQALQMGEIPDIDALIDSNMQDSSGGGSGRRGRVGRKSPKANPASIMGMKK